MTTNDMIVSCRRLRNDAEQLRGRQRSLIRLSQGRLHEKWKAEYRALAVAIEALEDQANALETRAEEYLVS